MTTENLWRTLRATWWMLAIGAVAGALAGLLALGIAPKHYESTSRVLIQVEGDGADLQAQQTAVEGMLPTYIAIAGSDDSLAATRARLSDPPSIQQLRRELLFVADEDSPTIIVTGQGDSPQAAADMADAGATTLREAVEDGDGGTVDATPQIIEKAVAPSSPSSPDPKIVLPAGIILGALIVLVAVLVRQGRTRLPVRMRQVEAAAGGPLLGILEPAEARLARAARATGAPTSAEGIRGLLQRLPHRTIALVHASTVDDARLSRIEDVITTQRAASRREADLRRVPLDDGLSSLPADAVAVLVIDEGSTRSAVSRAATFSRGHGVAVAGCIIVPRDSRADVDQRVGAEDAADPGENDPEQNAPQEFDGHPAAPAAPENELRVPAEASHGGTR
jgi:capsular polysaccharide biosynthesis protein